MLSYENQIKYKCFVNLLTFIYRCLKENGWDYKKASISYLRLKSRIPLAAYKR